MAKYVKNYFIILFVSLFVITVINYYIDPLWNYKHSNSLNNKQQDFDERQTKTNYLNFVDNNFNSLILGSSRTTYMNQNLFRSESTKFFNYSANGMRPFEYNIFIEYFKKSTFKKPKFIVIGLDFFGIHKNRIDFRKDNYLESTHSRFYKYKNLLSLDVLLLSIKNIKQNLKIKKPYYDRSLNKYHLNIKGDLLESQIKNTLIKSFDGFGIDKGFDEILKKIKNNNMESRIIIFIPPVVIEQLIIYKQMDYLKYYYEFLSLIINNFGSVYNFMIPSILTSNHENFFDANHATKDTNTHIASILKEDILTNTKLCDETCYLLNKNNFDEFVKDFEYKMEILENKNVK